MNLTSALNLLEQLKTQEDDPEDSTIALEIICILLDYINNEQIRTKVNSITF